MPLVLVIDDSPAVRNMLVKILNGIGLSALSAVDGAEGLTMFKSLRPDLVISDMSMPRMGGIQLLQAIRQDDKLAQVPLILMGSANRKEEAWGAGCEFFLRKPFTAPRVGEVVGRALDNGT
jgi:CheY-like chemotaxis protein